MGGLGRAGSWGMLLICRLDDCAFFLMMGEGDVVGFQGVVSLILDDLQRSELDTWNGRQSHYANRPRNQDRAARVG